MIDKILEFIFRNPWFTLLGGITVIQIAPIKINPWSWIGDKLKFLIVGDLEKTVRSLQKEFVDEKITNKRWHVLDFTNSCRQGRKHTKEEWEHCLEELKAYEAYCTANKIPNGVMEESAKYIRNVFHERLKNNDFLV